MNQRAIVVVLISILATLPSAVGKEAAPGAVTGAPGVELTQAPPKSQAPPGRDAATNVDAVANADARHCLEFPTNVQIIMCAEKYLPRKRNP
jgi:hypothetical protein